MSKIKHILSVIHYTICGAVCFQSTHFSCDDWENIYILCLIIIIKSEVWTITHSLGFGHETMVSAVCRAIFLSNIITHGEPGKSPNVHGFAIVVWGGSVDCGIVRSHHHISWRQYNQLSSEHFYEVESWIRGLYFGREVEYYSLIIGSDSRLYHCLEL